MQEQIKYIQRGRPVKKPGYDREAEIDSLINTAVDLAVEPFDDMYERDPALPTLTEIAETMETTLLRVRNVSKDQRLWGFREQGLICMLYCCGSG